MLDVLDAVPEAISGTFFDLLSEWKAADAIGSDDLIAAVLPLFEQVKRQHERGAVAPLDGVDHLRLHEGRELWFNAADGREDRADQEALQAIAEADRAAIDVIGEIDVVEEGQSRFVGNRRIAERGVFPEKPLHYLDYTTWEMAAGHHDALADIFALGMILGSLATRLDFTQRLELQQFLVIRRNVHGHNPRIHPVISRVIAHMTELDRSRRAQDLGAIIETLADYRRVETDDFEDRLSQLEKITDPGERRVRVQEYLRNRLFEISRRNRLVYFKETSGSANLTTGSLPYTLDHRSIKASQIFFTSERLCRELHKLFEDETSLPLMSRLRFEDYPFLQPTLDKIRLAAQGDIKEYGFSQLRLVLATLRWHNVLRDRAERIHSPLILIPVALRKQRGTEDGFELTPTASLREAEINPVLTHHLRDVYGIELPETIDLTNFASLNALQDSLAAQIRRRHAGIEIQRVDRPRIHLIRKTVRRQVEDYKRRRKRTGRGLRDYAGFAYSYDPDNYAPLGITLFNQHVRATDAPGREMVGRGSPADVSTARPETERETSRDFYSLDQGTDSDPMNWEIDLTSVTLSNFNYRKMSLVRDYAELKNGKASRHDTFDQLFNADVRSALQSLTGTSWSERHLVLPTDPSQEAAVLRARSGESYVIQGPPGTGKSQTIANLLADFAARGKKVLFVCEKRVALDVVFHRLAEAGLKDLTTLVHDTKGDKKAFIAELKSIYEAWREPPPGETAGKDRAEAIADIERIIAELQSFSDGMTGPAAGSELPLRRMIHLAVDRDAGEPWLDGRARETLPAWSDVERVRSTLQEIESNARSQLPTDVRPQRLLAHLDLALARHDRLIGFLTDAVAQARGALPTLQSAAQTGSSADVAAVLAKARIASQLKPLTRAHKLSLIDPHSPDRLRFDESKSKLERRQRHLQAADQTSPWVDALSPQETETALAIARKREASWLSFLYGDWRRLKRRIAQGYRGEILSHVAALEQLAAAHAARAELARDISDLAAEHGAEDLETIAGTLDEVTRLQRGRGPEAELVERALASPGEAERLILTLAGEHEALLQAKAHLDALYRDCQGLPLDAMASQLELLQRHVPAVAELLPLLGEAHEKSPGATDAWRALDLPLADLERACLIESVARTFKAAPALARVDGNRMDDLISGLDRAISALRPLNARHILEACRARFRESMALVEATGRGASASPRHAAYREGCKQLEHQFGLIRPSKSLRELLSGETGVVLRDLKPIWMMSPLSVADTLPFAEDLFDAVVFDEASQIPLEDAVPTLYRAVQTIIVGDEMQLPPTSFFSSGSDASEPLPDYIAYAVSADSLLTRANASLGSTKLNWHYRSRHESLINFCNRAFYGGELNTVPSRQPLVRLPAIVPIEPNAQAASKRKSAGLARDLLERPLSLHSLADGVFRNQQNEAEAEYIADLVQSLLKSKAGKSIGIVAFSQPQAQAIESALEALAAANKPFAGLIEAEREREDGGQFAGLFVKNLENVQGDERDIIIISVGYAPDPMGKMRMNFGPINQAGGEKRLNVIFSRARHHVAIVTSIHHGQITNDYNVGANTLKQYLRYAAAVSAGDVTEMTGCLNGLGHSRGHVKSLHEADAICERVAADIAASGEAVERGFGHATLQVDVAARPADARAFERAILVDTEAHYEIGDIVERYVTRPAVLRAFGWQVSHVFGRDFVLRPKRQ